MAAPAPEPRVRYAEYVALEEKSLTKHEWLDGVMLNMEALGRTRGTPEHAGRISAALGELRDQLVGRPFRVFPSDLRLRVLDTGLATYPDGSVVAGRLRVDPADQNAATNPVVLVEVLSDSSEAYDRGQKFAHYRRIPSLREYVLVSQHEPLLEVWRKNEAGKWVLAEEAGAGQVAELASIGCSLSVDEVYRNPLEEARAEAAQDSG